MRNLHPKLGRPIVLQNFLDSQRVVTLMTRDKLNDTAQSIEHQANKRKHDLVFNVNDLVWLDTRNLCDKRLKIVALHAGPFVITKVLGSAYTL
jgi:hypothetical protein